jgi:hypothetical protein
MKIEIKTNSAPPVATALMSKSAAGSAARLVAMKLAPVTTATIPATPILSATNARHELEFTY